MLAREAAKTEISRMGEGRWVGWGWSVRAGRWSDEESQRT